MMKQIKWGDVAIHAGVALAALVVWHYLGLNPFLGFAINTVAWPIREMGQHRPNYAEIFTHPQSLMEWVAPVWVGLVVLAVLVS